jgi:hypothetical protein
LPDGKPKKSVAKLKYNRKRKKRGAKQKQLDRKPKKGVRLKPEVKMKVKA